MIKVQSLTNTDKDENTYFVVAFADTKAEVQAGGQFVGLPEGASIEQGSRLMTSGGELAYMRSDGRWNWGDED